jgi:hypothetical protein
VAQNLSRCYGFVATDAAAQFALSSFAGMIRFSRCLLSLVSMVVLVGCESKPGTGSSSPQSTSPAPITSLQVGDQCVLTAKGSPVFVYPQYEDMNEVMDALIAKDDIGLQKMKAAGKFFVCPARTRARLINNGVVARRVRILEGDYYGEDGWVSTEFVQPVLATDNSSTIEPKSHAPASKKSPIKDATANRDLANAKRLIGKKDSVARHRLKAIVEKYPDSDAAAEAQQLLGK